MGIRRGTIVLMSVLLMAGLIAPATAAPPERVEVFVGFFTAPGAAEHRLLQQHGGSVGHSYQLVPAVAATIPVSAIERLERNPRVAYVEPVIEAVAVAHDATTNTELDNTWGVEHIGAGVAHAADQTGAGVRVAVLDSGIDTNHPDLAYDAACSGATSYSSVEDGSSHGTHVAGTIAAIRGNGGVVGVGPALTLCIYKVLGDDGSGSFADIVAALNEIARYNREEGSANPIRVTNNSYGSSGDPGITVSSAFDALATSGVLHIGAAGNSGRPRGNGSTCIYPALYDSVMAVAATGSTDTRASFSSTCDQLELSAPGVGINSTIPGGGYGTKSGTSMAAPHVAGAAGLAFAARSGIGAADVRALLKSTALSLGANHSYGAGLVQADAVVPTVPPPVATGMISGTVSTTGGSLGGATVSVGGIAVTATTETDGTYTLSDIPTGDYTIVASLDGYEPVSRSAVTVTENTTTIADFTLSPSSTTPPGEGPSATVSDISYATGGRWHLVVTVTVTADGAGVAGADVSLTIVSSDGTSTATGIGTTGSDGTVAVQFNNALREAKCYTTTVTAMSVAWDGLYPPTSNCPG